MCGWETTDGMVPQLLLHGLCALAIKRLHLYNVQWWALHHMSEGFSGDAEDGSANAHAILGQAL